MDQYIRKYGKRLYGLCMTLCADKHEADDLYQDTWVKVIRSFDSFDASKDFEPWLTRLCVNTYRDKLRRLSRSPFLNFTSNETKDAVFSTAPAPEREDYSDLYAAIDQLPENCVWRSSYSISRIWTYPRLHRLWGSRQVP